MKELDPCLLGPCLQLTGIRTVEMCIHASLLWSYAGQESEKRGQKMTKIELYLAINSKFYLLNS